LIGYAEEPLTISKSLVPQVKRGFNNICEKILGSEEAAVEAYLQLEAFRRKEGTFSNDMAFKTVNKMPAYQWWSLNIDEDEAPELKLVAEKVQISCHMHARVCIT
jgi:hypothetical protein